MMVMMMLEEMVVCMHCTGRAHGTGLDWRPRRRNAAKGLQTCLSNTSEQSMHELLSR